MVIECLLARMATIIQCDKNKTKLLYSTNKTHTITAKKKRRGEDKEGKVNEK